MVEGINSLGEAITAMLLRIFYSNFFSIIKNNLFYKHSNELFN